MKILNAEFASSISDLKQFKLKGLPEFAFIGRSNVGKSSLINMLTGRKQLAKISGTPGKTQTINHFVINQSWYIVDLPGYGFAKASKASRMGFGKIIGHYILNSTKLFCLFILIDSRLYPQKIDLEFINWTGTKEIPIALVFTKADKISTNQCYSNVRRFQNELLNTWDELPPIFVTSSTAKTGKQELLAFIESTLESAKKN